MPAICVNKSRHSLDLQFSFYDNSKEVSKLNDVSEARQIASIDTFKQFLNSRREKVPKYFYCGSRRGQLLHTRPQTNCSNLNNDYSRKISTILLCAFVGILKMLIISFMCVPCTRGNTSYCIIVLPNINSTLHWTFYCLVTSLCHTTLIRKFLKRYKSTSLILKGSNFLTK